MKRPENPWHVPGKDESPDWRMRRRHAMYSVLCPICGQWARPYYVGGNSSEVRCALCNARFDPKKHTTRRTNEDED